MLSTVTRSARTAVTWSAYRGSACEPYPSRDWRDTAYAKRGKVSERAKKGKRAQWMKEKL